MNVIYPFLLYLLLYEPLASVLYRIFHDALGLDLTRLFCLLCSGLFALVLELDLLRRGPGTYSDFHKIELKNGKALHFPGSILLAVVAGSLLNRGITYLSTRIVSKGFADADATLRGSGLPVLYLATVIVLPLLVEVVFRGILLGRLDERFGRAWGILLSSLLFGLIHFNLIQFLYAFLCGMILSLLVIYNRNLWASVIAHSILNLITILSI